MGDIFQLCWVLFNIFFAESLCDCQIDTTTAEKTFKLWGNNI